EPRLLDVDHVVGNELPEASVDHLPLRLDPAVVLGLEERDDPPAAAEHSATDVEDRAPGDETVLEQDDEALPAGALEELGRTSEERAVRVLRRGPILPPGPGPIDQTSSRLSMGPARETRS